MLVSRLCRADVWSVVGPPKPVHRAQGLLRRKRTQAVADWPTGSQTVSSWMLWRNEARLGLKGRALSTVNSCTTRLGRSARVELSSTTGGFK